jgi:hypothetical protein
MQSNFPTRAPVGLIAGFLLGVFSILPILVVWQRIQPPVQRFYLGQYVVTYLSATPIGTVAAFFKGSNEHTYHVLAQNGHLVSGAVAGTRPLTVHVVHGGDPAAFHAWLRTQTYGGREVPDLVRGPIGIWSFVAVGMFGVGALLDFRRRKRAREGMQLRGGEMLTVDEFNYVTKGDGFGLYVKN